MIREITSQGQSKQGAAGPTGLILNRATSAVTVNNSVAETNLYSFTIPGGTMSATSGIRLTLLGLDHLNNTGGNVTFRWKLKLGASSVFDTGNLTVGPGANRGSITFGVTGLNLNATNSQGWSGYANGMITGASVLTANGLTVGQGNTSNGSEFDSPWQNTTAVDMTAAQTLAFTITMGTANALAEAKLLGAILELL